MVQICSLLEGVGYASAEWLAELEAMSATELEQLIAAAMTAADETETSATAAASADDLEANNNSSNSSNQWVLPEAANRQLMRAEKDIEQFEIPPVVIEVNHEVRT
eukprot:COSAG06_NODE_2406_length_6930_cov_2.986532_3_plen_106_part_00